MLRDSVVAGVMADHEESAEDVRRRPRRPHVPTCGRWQLFRGPAVWVGFSIERQRAVARPRRAQDYEYDEDEAGEELFEDEEARAPARSASRWLLRV